jgi:hypothetical protein
MPEQSRFGVHSEKPRFGGWDVETPGHESRDNGHEVAVLQKRVRLKFRD